MSILSKKYLPPLLGIATLTWIVGGTYWYKTQFCDVSVTASTTVSISHTRTHLPFYFPFGTAQPIFTKESFSIFKKTTNYLNEHSDKKLIIKGLYTPQEVPNQAPSTLGLERAEAIKSVLLNLGSPNSSIETRTEQRNNLFFSNQQLFDGVEFKVVDYEGGRFQALNLFFQKDKFQFEDNDELKKYFHALNDYMRLHPNIKLKITAHQDNTEGAWTSKKRMAFMHKVLENHNFLPKQFEFEDAKSKILLAENGHIKNRRVEIRLIIP